jgi:hypothetical protein
MAATNYTPISLYYSTTSGASGVPNAANLVNGELAINITDGKLFYKDNSGVVQVLATKSGASGVFSSITNTGLTSGRVVYSTTGGLETDSANLLFNGTTLTANTLNLTNALGTTYGGTGLTSFTANGVVYASSSSVLATGSALTFDGTNLSLLPSGYSVFGASSAEQMRLTSTGLGIGTSSPAEKLQVVGKILSTGDGRIGVKKDGSDSVGAGPFFGMEKGDATRAWFMQLGASNTFDWWYYSGGAAYTKYMSLDGSGNLGLGVTPSAWGSTQKALQVRQAVLWNYNNLENAYLGSNYYFDNTNRKYIINGYATEYSQGSGAHAWFTAPSGTAGNAITFTQAMTLDASGNLSIGTTSVFNSASNRGNISLNGATDSIFNFGIAGANSAYIRSASGVLELSAIGSSFLQFTTNGSERARIDSSGNLLVGTTTFGQPNENAAAVGKSDGAFRSHHATGSISSTIYAYFTYAGLGVGSITQNGTTGVLYNITSDQRLKENIKDSNSASDLIDAIQVRQFDWKSDGSHQRYGFVAQELVSVAPEAVNQPADPDEMMAVDYSKLVPMLVKEIQSLRIRIAQLEAK